MRTSPLPFILSLVLVLAACSATSDGDIQTVSSSSSESSVMSSAETQVVLLKPEPGSKVTSPIEISAKAPGTWFSEASIPVELTDADGNTIAVATGQAEGEWMTVDLVTFDATVAFSTTAKEGFIVIKKDNPSGLPENDESMKFAVKLQ